MPTASSSPRTSGSRRWGPASSTEHPAGPARVERDQPGRPVSGGLGLEQLPGLPDDLRPEDRVDGATDRAQHRRRQRPDGRRRRAAVLARLHHRHLDPVGSTVGVPVEVQLQRQHRGSHPRRHADLPVREQRQPGTSRLRPRGLHVLQRLRRCGRVRREQRRRVRRRQRRRAAVRDGALAGRVEAVRGAQRRQQARRDRHRHRHGAQTKSRSATRRARSCSPATAQFAYVSNEGGRPSTKHDFTNLSDGTPIVSSPSTGAAITGTVSVVNLKTGQGDPGDPCRAPADRALPGRRRPVRRQLQRRQPVGDRRADEHGHPDRPDQPGAGRAGRELRERDQHVRPDPRARQHRARQRDRRLPLPRPLPPDAVRRLDPDGLVSRAGPARPGARRRDAIVVTNDKGIGAQGPESTINKGATTRPAATEATTPTTTPAA